MNRAQVAWHALHFAWAWAGAFLHPLWGSIAALGTVSGTLALVNPDRNDVVLATLIALVLLLAMRQLWREHDAKDEKRHRAIEEKLDLAAKYPSQVANAYMDLRNWEARVAALERAAHRHDPDGGIIAPPAADLPFPPPRRRG